MWQQLEKASRYIAKYFWTFGRCFSGPQNFAGSLFSPDIDPSDDKHGDLNRFHDALTFVASSVFFAVLLQMPFFEKIEFWRQIILSIILTLFGVLSVALALRFSWLCVGGRTAFIKYFVIDAYVAGVATVLFTLVAILQSAINQLFQLNEGHFVSYSIFLTGLLVVGARALVFWEAYRLLNNVGQLRAFLALVVFHGVMLPTLFLLYSLDQYFITTYLTIQ